MTECPPIKAKVTVAGHKSGEVLFILNTALDVPLVISDHFAQQHHFFSSHMKTVPIAPGELGVGGNAVMARIEDFQIGPYEVAGSARGVCAGEVVGRRRFASGGRNRRRNASAIYTYAGLTFAKWLSWLRIARFAPTITRT